MEGGIFLLLGSNLGDRLRNLSEARNKIGSVVKSSPVYTTAAWGNTSQPDFLNQVVEINSRLFPEELLRSILDIEAAMGRKREEKWGSRIIDIDILFYQDIILKTPDLVIPHPEMQNRRFVLVPLHDVTNKVHPVLNKTVGQLLKECKDTLEVKRLPPLRSEQSS
jgi:2-amino-4-hydroxy-6-hydroxymethyldihydropteridine diphosphokinase